MTVAKAGDKYEVARARLLQSSAHRGWSGVSAEFRLHVSGRADAFVQPVTEISMVFGGKALVRRRDSGQSHSMSPLNIAARLSSAGKLDPRRLSRVLEYIHAHLGDALDIRGMASAASLSRFHFARSFKASTGQTPYQYVSAKRLTKAKVLLAQNQPLAEIALALNFSSQTNFTRAFRREFGITPGQYREQKSR